jgi:hypothetical protein
MFSACQAVLSFKFDQDNENEKAIVDLCWLKLYSLCKRVKDIELAFIAATAVSNEAKRETALGGLIEELIVNDSLNTLFN